MKIPDELICKAIAESHDECKIAHESGGNCLHAEGCFNNQDKILTSSLFECKSPLECWFLGLHVGYRLAQLVKSDAAKAD